MKELYLLEASFFEKVKTRLKFGKNPACGYLLYMPGEFAVRTWELMYLTEDKILLPKRGFYSDRKNDLEHCDKQIRVQSKPMKIGEKSLDKIVDGTEGKGLLHLNNDDPSMDYIATLLKKIPYSIGGHGVLNAKFEDILASQPALYHMLLTGRMDLES